ncbi:MAG TPA: ABC transporter ATP-binding protein [Candidatus Sulfomarinibacteraceae bacterium]|nr:ABC transporter ATP-binding protein [Candidatus Sulfomarinibacteraceae bacterium]
MSELTLPTQDTITEPAVGLASDVSKPLLSVQNLHIWYELRKWGFGHAGYVRAVDDVSFDLPAGKAIAVVGESGCGKSSLMKAILGLVPPHKGSIIFRDRDVAQMDKEGMHWYRSQVGYVQQDPFGALPPFMSVETILNEPLAINGVKGEKERERRIREALEEVKLTPVENVLNKYPHMLSGGQQQRVVIARAMILEPKLLVADEPVSMLDASVRVEILKLLRGLQESHNLSVIYITHDLSTVRYFSEYIFVMYAGKLVEKASVNQILYNAGHPYTQALLEGTSEPDARNASIYKEIPPGEPPSLVSPPPGCRFHPRCPEFMEGTCDVKEPPDFLIEAGHHSACWLHEHK